MKSIKANIQENTAQVARKFEKNKKINEEIDIYKSNPKLLENLSTEELEDLVEIYEKRVAKKRNIVQN